MDEVCIRTCGELPNDTPYPCWQQFGRSKGLSDSRARTDVIGDLSKGCESLVALSRIAHPATRVVCSWLWECRPHDHDQQAGKHGGDMDLWDNREGVCGCG